MAGPAVRDIARSRPRQPSVRPVSWTNARAIAQARRDERCPPRMMRPPRRATIPRAPGTQDAYPRAPISETAILAVSSSPAMKTCRGAQIGLAPEHSPRGPQGCSRARRIGVSRRLGIPVRMLKRSWYYRRVAPLVPSLLAGGLKGRWDGARATSSRLLKRNPNTEARARVSIKTSK
jgi:hypothetical protein